MGGWFDFEVILLQMFQLYGFIVVFGCFLYGFVILSFQYQLFLHVNTERRNLRHGRR